MGAFHVLSAELYWGLQAPNVDAFARLNRQQQTAKVYALHVVKVSIVAVTSGHLYMGSAIT